MHEDPTRLLAELVGMQVVIDMSSAFVAIGTLDRFGHDWLVLSDADMHDLRDTGTTREKYILDCREHGVAPNRRCVWLAMRDVIGISRLADVLID